MIFQLKFTIYIISSFVNIKEIEKIDYIYENWKMSFDNYN